MKKIIFMLIPLVIAFLAFRPVSTHQVTGKVTDQYGQPVMGVSVQLKGATTVSSTAQDGSYQITVPDKKGVLVFSMVGYEVTEVDIKGRSVIDVSLTLSANALQEVIVVGYGKQSKRVKTSAPLAGAVPGLQISNASRTDGFFYHRDRMPADFNTEDYDHINENKFLKVTDNPLSTFSIDVDAASYSNIRRFLNQGHLPPSGAVRIEEMINYFKYDYEQPAGEHPFAIHTEISTAPWNSKHKLVMIGLQGKKIPTDILPASNLVFLIDVSGSMDMPNKLPLVKTSMKLLVDQLRDDDRVSIVVYAGAAGLVLKPTKGTDKATIREAIDNLQAGGSTAGGAGLRLAYKTAREYFVKEGNNRVILCTDGDFNVGESSDDAMERLIEEERESGVFLTVLGYGMGNYKDNKMQKLANKGNGNHAYIDGLSEAKKILVNEFGGTLFTIAKDVKLQVEFNPAKVQGYRLIGYENRMLAKEDFNDDKKDAGELGSGHTVTALYEIIPVGVNSSFLKDVDPLKYGKKAEPLSKSAHADEIMTVKFRYKAPDAKTSKLIEHPLRDQQTPIASASNNFRFAAAVAEFGMLLRQSEFKGESSFEQVVSLARKAKGEDEEGYRAEFIRLVENAEMLAKGNRKEPEKGLYGKRD